MAVYKRSYREYAGRYTPERWRFLVLTRFALAELFEMRLFLALALVTLVPVLVFACGIYLVNNESARALLQMGGKPPFDINNRYFLSFLQTQGWFCLLLTAFAGPTLIAGDLANGALPLLLSRPMSRTEYVLGKLAALFVILSGITWIPGLLLFGLGVQMGPDGWLAQNWRIAPALVVGSLAWIGLLSLLALALSAWVKWRVIASGLFLATFFIPAGFGEAFNETLRTHWGVLLNVVNNVWLIWSQLLDLPTGVRDRRGFHEIPVEFAWAVLLGLCFAAIAMLNRRLRAREVVRG